jgi:hypothetical protein
MNFGYNSSFKTLDKGLIEQFGPTGLGFSIFNTAFNVTAFQSGFVYHTIFFLISCFLFYFFFYFSISLGFVLTIYNIQFFLIIFGFCLVSLSKTF